MLNKRSCVCTRSAAGAGRRLKERGSEGWFGDAPKPSSQSARKLELILDSSCLRHAGARLELLQLPDKSGQILI
jgi:hypothetical protein